MKFLIDECLHPSLAQAAHASGHDAYFVGHIGLSGEKDWDLMVKVIEEDLTLVTNNAADFRRLYAKEGLHAGLVIIVPNVPPNEQLAIFSAILDDIGQGEDALVNTALEASIEAGELRLRRYALPKG